MWIGRQSYSPCAFALWAGIRPPESCRPAVPFWFMSCHVRFWFSTVILPVGETLCSAHASNVGRGAAKAT
jgi:hypothetical protein